MRIVWLVLCLTIFLAPLPAGESPISAVPAAANDFTRLTTHADMMTFLAALDRSSTMVRLAVEGHSVEGRDIPVLYFSRGEFGTRQLGRPVVMIFCQQHGNEPSGKEAALLLARELATDTSGLLDAMDLMLIPMVNPDGAEAGRRTNGHDRDLNRNHVILTEPETRMIHDLFHRWMPEVTMDIHEYNAITRWWVRHGMVKNADVMLGGVTNLNIDPSLMDLSRQVIIPAVGKRVAADGYRLVRYIVGSPFETDRVRYSTVAIDDGRQSLGIYDTLSFIQEGKRYGNLTNKLKRRTRSQLSALKAFLATVAERRTEIVRAVRDARRRVISGADLPPRAFIQMDYFPDPERKTLSFPVFDLEAWRAEDRPLDHFEPRVQIKKSVARPTAYVIPGGEKALLDLLVRHHIRTDTVTTRRTVDLEHYRIWHVAARMEEELTMPCIDTELRTDPATLEPGDVLVPLHQPAGLLIPLLLEPASSWGILTDSGNVPSLFATYAQPGQDYPVRRLPAPRPAKSATTD